MSDKTQQDCPRPRLRLLLVLLALTTFLLPQPSFAQFDAATVLGLVKDESGGAVPGAAVTLTNLATGITSTTTTEADGSYQILNVKVGTYSLKAELQGFTTAVAEKFDVTVNARQRVDMTLKVGSVGETLQVTGAARLLESESSDRGQVVKHEQIVSLPLNGRAY